MGRATVQGRSPPMRSACRSASVKVEYGDSELPIAPMAGGATQTASVAAALLAACDKLKRSMLALARRSGESPLRGQRLDRLEARDGGLYQIGKPGVGEKYTDILGRAAGPRSMPPSGPTAGSGRWPDRSVS